MRRYFGNGDGADKSETAQVEDDEEGAEEQDPATSESSIENSWVSTEYRDDVY